VCRCTEITPLIPSGVVNGAHRDQRRSDARSWTRIRSSDRVQARALAQLVLQQVGLAGRSSDVATVCTVGPGPVIAIDD